MSKLKHKVQLRPEAESNHRGLVIKRSARCASNCPLRAGTQAKEKWNCVMERSS